MLGETKPIRETHHPSALAIGAHLLRNELWGPWYERWKELDGVDLYGSIALEPGAGAIYWGLRDEAQDAG